MTKIHKNAFARKMRKRSRKNKLSFIANPQDAGKFSDRRPPKQSHWFSPILPEHEFLILCKTQRDTQTINANFSDSGVVAVCLANFIHVPSSVISQYRKQFESDIFVLFPQHKACDGENLARVSGFKFLDFQGALSAQKVYSRDLETLSEGFAKFGFNTVGYALLYAFDTCHILPKYDDDNFSIAVPQCYKVNFQNYVSEAGDKLEQILTRHDKLILQSGAGTGKSTWLIKLANGQLHNVVLNCSHFVVVEPKTSIAQQLYIDFQKGLKGYDPNACVMVSGGMDEEELHAMQSAKIIICVLDSLPKIAPIIKDSFLVVDEYHELSKDQDYRSEAMISLWEAMKIAKRKLLLSATPDLALTTNWDENLRYKLIVGQSEAPNHFDVKFKLHKCPKRQLLTYVEEEAPQKKGVICLKYDRDTTLLAYQKYFESRFVDTDYFCSKRAENKQSNLNYNSLMERGEIDPKLDYLFFTKLLESGVSFKFDMRLLCLFDARSYQEIIQLATRARYDVSKGRNLKNDIWIFRPEKQSEKPKNTKRIEQRFFDIYHTALDCAKRLDKLNTNGKIELSAPTDIKFFIYTKQQVCPITNALETVHVVNIPAILHKLYVDSVSECSLELLQKRITRFDSRFSCAVESVKVETCEEIESILAEVKASREESEKAFLGLLQSDLEATAHATCYLSKNMDFKEYSKRALRLGLQPREATKKFIIANPKAFAFDHKPKAIRAICSLVEGGMSPTKAVGAVCSLDKQELQTCVTASTLRKRHTQLASAPEDLSAIDKYQCKVDKAIFSKVDKIRKNQKAGKYKNGLSKDDICALVNASLVKVNKNRKKTLNPTKALAKIKSLYEVSQFRKTINNKRIWRYKIGGRKFALNRGKI